MKYHSSPRPSRSNTPATPRSPTFLPRRHHCFRRTPSGRPRSWSENFHSLAPPHTHIQPYPPQSLYHNLYRFHPSRTNTQANFRLMPISSQKRRCWLSHAKSGRPRSWSEKTRSCTPPHTRTQPYPQQCRKTGRHYFLQDMLNTPTTPHLPTVLPRRHQCSHRTPSGRPRSWSEKTRSCTPPHTRTQPCPRQYCYSHSTNRLMLPPSTSNTPATLHSLTLLPQTSPCFRRSRSGRPHSLPGKSHM
jgi:hypothetical protein